MTQTKRVLWLSWSGKRSRFLQELGVAQDASERRESKADASAFATTGGWSGDNVPPYVVLPATACCMRITTLASVVAR